MLPGFKKLFGLSSSDHNSTASPAIHSPGQPFNDAPSPPASAPSQRRIGFFPNYRSTMRPHSETHRRAAASEEERRIRPNYRQPSDAVVIGKPTGFSGGNMPNSTKPGSRHGIKPQNTLLEQRYKATRSEDTIRPAKTSSGAGNPPSERLQLQSSRGDNVSGPEHRSFSGDDASPRKKRQKIYHSGPPLSGVVDLTDEDHEPHAGSRERRHSEVNQHFNSYASSRSQSGHSVPSAVSVEFSATEFNELDERMHPWHHRSSRPSPGNSTVERPAETITAARRGYRAGAGSSSQPMELSDDEIPSRQQFVIDTLLKDIDGESKPLPIKSRLNPRSPSLDAEHSSRPKGHRQNTNGTNSHRSRLFSEFQKEDDQGQNGKALDRASSRQIGKRLRQTISDVEGDGYGSEDELQQGVPTPFANERERAIRGFEAEPKDGTKSHFFSHQSKVPPLPHPRRSPGPIPRTSRSDIKPSHFASTRGGKDLPKLTRKPASSPKTWPLKAFKIPRSPVISDPDMCLRHVPEERLYKVYRKEGPTFVPMPVGQGQVCIDMSKVNRAAVGIHGSTKVILSGSRDDNGIYKRFMEFSGSEVAQDFHDFLSKSTLKLHLKYPKEMDELFARADDNTPRNPVSEPVDRGVEDELLEARRDQRRQAAIERSHDKEHLTAPRPRPKKLISQLQPDISSVEPGTRTSRATSQCENLDPNNYQRPTSARSTRSSNRTDHQDLAEIYLQGPSSELEVLPQIEFPPEWKHALVYPPTGRNRAQVDHSDLKKLDDGEFLNDSIISFYMTWAAKEAEDLGKLPEKRVYWYNTHFYTTMAGASRGINYAAVQRWTSKVDIFSYDYVVIPINESMHWYLAVVCNLPKIAQRSMLKDKGVEKSVAPREATPEDSLDSQVKALLRGQARDGGTESVKEMELAPDPMEIDETVRSDGYPMVERTEEQRDSSDNDKRGRLLTPQPNAHGARHSPIDVDGAEDHGKAELQASGQQTSPRGKKGRKKQAPALRKYDPEQPVIILFDSLNESHPRTTRNIKEYLIEEGKTKRGLELDIKDFQGMTAKNIPQQNNWVDCGVYVCLYFQKFIDDPEQLVHKILQRELDAEADWGVIKPWQTRRDIVELLTRLYNEQDQRRKEERSKRQKEKKRLEEEKSDGKGSKPVSKQSSPEKTTEAEEKVKDHPAPPSPAPPARMSTEAQRKASVTPLPERTAIGKNPAVIVERAEKHAMRSPEPEFMVAASPTGAWKRKKPLQEPRVQSEESVLPSGEIGTAEPMAVEDVDEMLLDEVPDSQPQMEPHEVEAQLNHNEWASQLQEAMQAGDGDDDSGRRSKSQSKRPTPDVIDLDDSVQ